MEAVKRYHTIQPLSDELIRELLKKKWKKTDWIDYLIEQTISQVFYFNS